MEDNIDQYLTSLYAQSGKESDDFVLSQELLEEALRLRANRRVQGR